VAALAGGLETTPRQSAATHQSLDRALALDPNFALTYAFKAVSFGYVSQRNHWERFGDVGLGPARPQGSLIVGELTFGKGTKQTITT
jgi:hypothetical protein